MGIDNIKNVVIVGSGTMGQDILQVFLWGGYSTTIVDISDEQLEKAIKHVEKGFQRLQKKSLLEPGKSIEDYFSNLKKSTDLGNAVKDADFIVETASENMKIKKKIFQICSEYAPLHCILASNTSSMSITEMASATNRPEKVIGMHFFNPVPLFELVEIIYGNESSDESINIGVEIGANLPCVRGKRIVIKALKDVPGFVVSRIRATSGIYTHWAYDYAAEHGVPWNELDADCAGLGMPMLPLEMVDYFGVDISKHVTEYYHRALHPDFEVSKVVNKMVEDGNLGMKAGKGFYDWSKGRPKIDISKKAGIFNPDVFLACMINEGCRLLEQGVCTSWKTLDIAIKYGWNSPGPFAEMGGLTKYKELSQLLEETADKIGKEYLRPCNLMKTGEFLKYE
jgi:enoyl-CoA hydratase / 3-hydroxyacyl-CoA dehydrogenase